MTFQRRGAIVFTPAIAQTAIYLWLNHHPLLPSCELPLTTIDRVLPFLPWSVWIYLALLSSEGVLAMWVRDDATFRRMVVAYTLAMTVAFLTYALWPTRYPRPPLPEPDSWGGAAYRRLVAIDSSECCFPSGHVIVPAIVCFSLARDRRRFWPVILFVLLVPSVLTTKQHYFGDVIAGIVIAAAALMAAATLDRRRRGNGDRMACRCPRGVHCCRLSCCCSMKRRLEYGRRQVSRGPRGGPVPSGSDAERSEVAGAVSALVLVLEVVLGVAANAIVASRGLHGKPVKILRAVAVACDVSEVSQQKVALR